MPTTEAKESMQVVDPQRIPDFDYNVFFDDECVAGPGYEIAEAGGNLTVEQKIARRRWEEEQAAKAENRDNLSEHERIRRQGSPIDRFRVDGVQIDPGSGASSEPVLTVNHDTGEAHLRYRFAVSYGRGYRLKGAVEVTLPVESFKLLETEQERI